ncbi:hypothetical protein PTMSG1_06888 [Pyrenophora teres f. maculata]|nr:hypothetical protein PTMSG1_06888 [Pyrenophora teres f. maculata]
MLLTTQILFSLFAASASANGVAWVWSRDGTTRGNFDNCDDNQMAYCTFLRLDACFLVSQDRHAKAPEGRAGAGLGQHFVCRQNIGTSCSCETGNPEDYGFLPAANPYGYTCLCAVDRP